MKGVYFRMSLFIIKYADSVCENMQNRESLTAEIKEEYEAMNRDKEVEAFKNGSLSEEEKIKYEIAQELGILDKVLETGWKSLSAKETGRIGGLMTKRKKKEKQGKN